MSFGYGNRSNPLSGLVQGLLAYSQARQQRKLHDRQRKQDEEDRTHQLELRREHAADRAYTMEQRRLHEADRGRELERQKREDEWTSKERDYLQKQRAEAEGLRRSKDAWDHPDAYEVQSFAPRLDDPTPAIKREMDIRTGRMRRLEPGVGGFAGLVADVKATGAPMPQTYHDPLEGLRDLRTREQAEVERQDARRDAELARAKREADAEAKREAERTQRLRAATTRHNLILGQLGSGDHRAGEWAYHYQRNARKAEMDKSVSGDEIHDQAFQQTVREHGPPPFYRDVIDAPAMDWLQMAGIELRRRLPPPYGTGGGGGGFSDEKADLRRRHFAAYARKYGLRELPAEIMNRISRWVEDGYLTWEDLERETR
jgi:hypothetical protein